MFVSTATTALPANVDVTALSGFEQTTIFDMIDIHAGTSELSGVDYVSDVEVVEELMSVLADFVASDIQQPNIVERTPLSSIGNITNARQTTTTTTTTVPSNRRRSRAQKENVKSLSVNNSKRKRRATPGSLVEVMLRPTTRPW
ncbi:hypothetical protein VNI00_010347 [Paramarasmius palmivorus]|uniref:Uncharacterized protein n=1 Tax=Paramarasmius palmivorus TaxID=297713 RepID=A0AAW0CIV7_9AGAR